MISIPDEDYIPDDTKLLCEECGHLTTVDLAEKARLALGYPGEWYCPACGMCDMEMV